MAFAWQVIAGGSYQALPATQFYVEYHYFGSGGHDVVTLPSSTPLRDSVDAGNNTLFAGVRFGFGV